MSEIQGTLFNKRACGLWIAGVFILMVIYLSLHSETPTRALTATPLLSPPPPDRAFPLSQWQTREGEPIRISDARLKNPAKWGLRRR